MSRWTPPLAVAADLLAGVWVVGSVARSASKAPILNQERETTGGESQKRRQHSEECPNVPGVLQEPAKSAHESGDKSAQIPTRNRVVFHGVGDLASHGNYLTAGIVAAKSAASMSSSTSGT